MDIYTYMIKWKFYYLYFRLGFLIFYLAMKSSSTLLYWTRITRHAHFDLCLSDAASGEHIYLKIDAYGANLYASVAMFQIMKIDAYGGNLGSPLATNWHRNTGWPSIEAEVCDQCFGICWKCISKKYSLQCLEIS